MKANSSKCLSVCKHQAIVYGPIFDSIIDVKLRTTSNSIRLRLSQTDVQNFAENGIVREMILFGPESANRLSYALQRCETAENVTVTFENNCVTVSVPEAEAKAWISTDQVGIESNQTENKLSILVEKDFACLNPRQGEEDKDTFPHPNTGQTC